MTETVTQTQEPEPFRALLTPHRSLGPAGFLILMMLVAGVSFVTGVIFLMIGAWPVFAFFGLDVLLIYLAFRMNYRSGRLFETVELTPWRLRITRVEPSGASQDWEFNPYWVRVHVPEAVDGRTALQLVTQGRAFEFGRFLTDDERKEFGAVLADELAKARTARI
jgi:uncharacterized membrane protein